MGVKYMAHGLDLALVGLVPGQKANGSVLLSSLELLLHHSISLPQSNDFACIFKMQNKFYIAITAGLKCHIFS